MSSEMTPLERTLTTVGQKEPDRVPFFLNLTMHGAKELGLSIKEYYSRPEYVVRGQMALRKKFGCDSVSPFFYGAIDYEAWGGSILYFDDGPPNAGAPVIRTKEDIESIEIPDVHETKCLEKVLSASRMLKEQVGNNIPVINAVISPFSLPVMQMGFEHYLDLIFEEPELFRTLMKKNEEFCVDWSNALLEAGTTTIVYFDPLASTTISTPEMYRKTGFNVAKRTISRIKGPVAAHLASGRCLPVLDDIAATGVIGIGVSALEDLGEIKRACRGRLTVIGNLNGVEMRRWTPGEAEAAVKDAFAGAGKGGGFILSDNHGEIPWQVPDSVLFAMVHAARKWGKYPLEWIDSE